MPGRKAINTILNFCRSEKNSVWISELVEQSRLTDEEAQRILVFFEDKMADLYALCLDFSLKDGDNIPPEEYKISRQEFINQLSYWWLKVQSEWIRFNNLGNFKHTMLHQEDEILNCKAAICSFFLEPVAQHLDKKLIRDNIAFLKNMVRRSQFT